MHRTRKRLLARPRVREPLALFTGGLLAAATLTLGSAPGATAHPGQEEATAEDFQQVTLAQGAEETGEPMSLAVLPDLSVLHTSRGGELRITDSSGNTRISGALPVYTHDEEGLQGVGVDPGFAENRAVYLFYAQPLDTPSGDAPETGTAAGFARFEGVNRFSRSVLDEDGTLDTASEKKVLDVATSRGTRCHVGGDADFDEGGDSALAAPLGPDLARLLARSHEAGLSGPRPPGFYFKDPDGGASVALADQYAALLSFAERLRGRA